MQQTDHLCNPVCTDISDVTACSCT